VDASPAMIWFCRRTVRAPNVCFVEGDAYSPWSYPGAPVDHVGATRAWQNFVLDKQQLAEQLRRIMWAGGSASTSV
jgi:hypothetical protein